MLFILFNNLHNYVYAQIHCYHVHVYILGDTLDEPVFADGKVICFGQIIGVVLAKSQPLAQRAAKAVKVIYEDLPSVITIEVRKLENEYCLQFNIKVEGY